MDVPDTSRKPDRVAALAVMTLASGIINVFWSFGLFLAAVFFGLGTFFIGCICIPLGIYPLLLGILEIVYASRLMQNPISSAVRPAYFLAVMEILDTMFGNILALVVGILALIFYNDLSVRRYFGET